MTANIRAAFDRAEQKTQEAHHAAETAEAAKTLAVKHQAYLSHSVTLMLETMERFARGDLSVRAVPPEHDSNDEITKLFHGFNHAAETLQHLIAETRSVTEESVQLALAISSAMHELADMVALQSKQTTNVAAAVEQMSRTIGENAHHTHHASELANTNSQQATSGSKVMEQTLEKMRDITAMVNTSAALVQQLGDSSEQIRAIVAVIDEIADQTNLLALNAAIEAARAGEQGRGFAVVADEVRKLAERTSEATKEIAATVRHIQHDTLNAVQAMQNGKSEAQEGIGFADNAGQVLQDIVQGMRDVQTMVVQIAAATQEQSATSNQIAENVENISAATEESASTVQEVARASEDLERVMKALSRSIARFHV